MGESKPYKIINGNNLEVLDTFEENSIDSCITDPPYELGFMGKSWDNSGVAYNVELWKKVLKVLKPGGFLLAFGGSRTFYKVACAIEDAGFEIKDTIMWLYGGGFPKNQNIGEIVNKKTGQLDNEWNGWGTSLKPAFEPIIVARKPIKESVVNNILKYKVGGFNIEECKVENGRFPANVIHDGSEEVVANMPYSKGSQGKNFLKNEYEEKDTATSFSRGDYKPYNDEGSACRFFYCARASKKDREEGLVGEINTHPTVKPTALMQYLVRLVNPKGATILDIFNGSGSTGKATMFENLERNANYKYIGIELEKEYCEISEKRIENVFQQNNEQINLFDFMEEN